MKSNNKKLQKEYTKTVEACVNILEEITKNIKKHMKEQAKYSDSWGFVGDMTHVKEKLEEVNTFLKSSI